MAEKNNNKIVRFVFAALFIMGVFLLIWKIPYGWGAYDEPYYPATAYRFAMGDRPGIDEWDSGQWSAFLLTPFVSAFVKFTGSTDGIIVFCRYLFTVLQTVTALLIFLMLKRKSEIAAGMCAIVFLMYVPFNMMAVSYDTMGLQFMTLAVLLMYLGYMFPAGFLYSFSVLCNPLLAGVCIIMLLAAVIRKLEWKRLLMFVVGIMCAAAIYLAAVMMVSDIRDIIRNMPYLLTDPQHENRDLFAVAYNVLKEVAVAYFPWNILWLSAFVGAAADNKRSAHAFIWLTVVSSASLMSLAGFCLNVRTNYFMFPLAVTGLMAYLLCEKKDRKIFWNIYVAGLIYAFFMNLASNQELDIICFALTISDLASIVFIIQLYEEHREKRFAHMLLLLAVAQLVTQGISFTRNVFWESERIEQLNKVITNGPLKGIRTSDEHALEINAAMTDLTGYIGKKDGRILIADNNTWQYMYTQVPCGSYAVWLGGKNNAIIEKLIEYYKRYPMNIPEYIYISKTEESSWDEGIWHSIADKYGYAVSETAESIKLEKR